MKIFHGPLNIAGIAGTLAAAERQLGADSQSYCLPSKFYGFHTDHIYRPGKSQYFRPFWLLLFWVTVGWRFDVFHFYYGNSLTMSRLWDVPLLKRMGKKIFFYFHGCDIQNSKQVVEKYEYNACKDHWPMGCSANRKKAIKISRQYADGVFYSTPDLGEFLPGGIWLPQPIDTSLFMELRKLSSSVNQNNKTSKEIVISHAPSDRQIKGSKFLEQAVADLKESGYPVKLNIVENVSYNEAMLIHANADIVVDQLLIGAYGLSSIEFMALGKPVICAIREDLRDKYPVDLPILSANPHTIRDVLEKTIKNRDQWPELGMKGIEYVERVHSSHIIAAQTLKYYQNEVQRT